MKIIDIPTGYSTDDFADIAAVSKHFKDVICKDLNTRPGRIEDDGEQWIVRMKLAKKDLLEVMARIMADTSSQSVNIEDVEEMAEEIWHS